MEKILINNFDYPFWHFGGKFFEYCNYSKGIQDVKSFQVLATSKQNKQKIISDIFTSILIYDKLCISIDNFFSLMDILGYEDIVKLLQNKVIEVFDDGGYTPIVILNKNGYAEFRSRHGLKESLLPDEWEPFQNLEETINFHCEDCQSLAIDKENRIRLQLLIEKNSSNCEHHSWSQIKLISQELKYDLRNNNLVQEFGLKSEDIQYILPQDIYKILRLAHLNRGLINAHQINATSIAIDASAQSTLAAKLSPTLGQNVSRKPIDVFQKILQMKGIIDLGNLYSRKIIDIDDLINLRNDFNGKLFRYWFASREYSEEETLRELLNRSLPNSRTAITKYVRWIYPNIVGLFEPVSGFAASYVDSFIIDKILQGWHPSIFLDERLKISLDKRIKNFERQQLAKRVRRGFGSLKPTDPCPCQSGKKYKACCAKVLKKSKL